MKILHINSIAGIPQILAKYQSKLGHQVRVLDPQKADYYLKFGFYDIFPTQVIKSNKPKEIILKSILKSHFADIIHIHSSPSLLNWIKKIYPRKKVVLTFHGTDVRDKWDSMSKTIEKADFVSVSTKDLLVGAPDHVEYIPNPIDIEHFKRIYDFTKGLALFIYIKEEGQDKAEALALEKASELDLKLLVQRRTDWLIPYKSFPRFLERFEYFIDFRQSVKTKDWINDLSTTALQMLALGGKVLYQDKILSDLPSDYNPISVSEKWIKIYNNL